MNMTNTSYTTACAVILSATAIAVACSSDGGNGDAPAGGGSGVSAGAGPSGGATATGGVSASAGGASPSMSGGSSTAAAGSANSGGTAEAIGGAASGGTASSASSGGTNTGMGGAGGATKSAGCGVSTSLKSGRTTLSVSGAIREYVLRLPDDYDASRAYKLIFAFHARGGNAAQVTGSGNSDYYGLYSRAQGGAIFVAPEGLDAGWRNTDGRDIVFVKAMLSEFNSKLCVDQQRIFSVGFSFGGMMSDAIGCAMADVFRAIAPMAGGIPNADHPYSGCEQPNMNPIAVWMSHGDNDTTVPLADGKDALDLFVSRNKCQLQTAAVNPSPCVAYQGCTEGYPIHFCQFSGGHMVPSFASAAIWTFFDQF
jgi:polyhydroxybutyrate depolymerase